MAKSSVEGLRRLFRQARGRLEDGEKYRTWFRTTPSHDGSPHVEQEGPFLCFVVTERGTEYERRRTEDPDELLFWLMETVTFDMATRFELAHRRPNEDFRRQLFMKQEQLLHALRPSWGERCRRDLEKILRAHPFTDEEAGPGS